MIDRHDEIEADLDIEANLEDSAQDIELEDEEAQSADKIKLLRSKLKACEEEKMSHLEELQRAKADFLNAKKNLEADRVRDKERASMQFVEELLPLCDSFHMAMSNEEAWNSVDQVWRTGVESIHTQLLQVLESHKVTIVNPVHETFDPAIHEAMSNQAVETEAQHHTVIQVIQPGYTMTVGDKTEVLRPARVIVGEFKKD